MKRFVLGVLVGILLAAGLAVAGQSKIIGRDMVLSLWTGDGEEPGLYYYNTGATSMDKRFVFFRCTEIGTAKVTLPTKKTP